MNIENFHNKKLLGLIGLAEKAGKLVCGTDATIQDIERHKVEIVIIATDSSDKTKKNIRYICEKNKIEVLEFGTIDELSNSIGKNNKAIIGIKSKDFADGVRKLIKQNIGGDLLDG